MKYAVFYVAGYDRSQNAYARFITSTPDGPHDRAATVLNEMREGYPNLSLHSWHVRFVCLTDESIHMEL